MGNRPLSIFFSPLFSSSKINSISTLSSSKIIQKFNILTSKSNNLINSLLYSQSKL
nr:MAG TPA: hypothetical protein [Crassvirales sp.]